MAPLKDFDFEKRELEINEELEAVLWAESNAWVVRKIEYPGKRSCPDRLFAGHGVILLIEMKKPSARNKKLGGLSKGQELEFARYAAVGIPVKVCYTAKEAIEYLQGFMIDDYEITL